MRTWLRLPKSTSARTIPSSETSLASPEAGSVIPERPRVPVVTRSVPFGTNARVGLSKDRGPGIPSTGSTRTLPGSSGVRWHISGRLLTGSGRAHERGRSEDEGSPQRRDHTPPPSTL